MVRPDGCQAPAVSADGVANNIAKGVVAHGRNVKRSLIRLT